MKIEFLPSDAPLLQPATALAKETILQLQAYFQHFTFSFSLPFRLEGTSFQKKLWKCLLTLSPGTVLTYKDLAEQLATSPRAIGNACRSNKLPIIIPCHRIIGQKNLGGYAGETSGDMMNKKYWLLQHEQYIPNAATIR